MLKRALLSLFVLAGCWAGAVAAQSQPLAIEDFYRPPAHGAVEVSRDGRFLATTVPSSTGRLNIAIVDLQSRKGNIITSFRDYDVLSIRWVGNDRLVFGIGQLNTPAEQQRGGGLFSIDREGREVRTLTEPLASLISRGQNVWRRYTIERTIPGNDEEILASGNFRDADGLDVYRLNIRTGRNVLLTPTRPPRVEDWLLDNDRVPRVAVSSVKDTNTLIVWYRKNAESPFEEIYRFDRSKPGMMVPIRFESDNKTLLVATNIGRSNIAIHQYDPEARKLGAVVLEHPRYDVGLNQAFQGAGGVLTDVNTDELIGYSVLGDRTEIIRLTEGAKRMQRTLDAALPGTINTWQRVRGDLYLVTASSDRVPATWYLYDEGKRTLEQLFTSRPWLGNGRLVEMRPFTLKTRDGLEIPSYYFLPANRKPGEKLPTIVHIHGGPAVRADIWGQIGFGFLEGQLFASRGYAVILPNFRITPGLGDKNYFAGLGTIGRQMVDDHQDAAKWAIDQGIADPNRICISGASYGGYATLMSLARFPDTFKCGISGLMVSDLRLQLTSTATDFAAFPAAVQFWLDMIGVKSTSDIPPELSPVNLADRIKQPLFIYAGGADVRTPIEQTNRMIRALERAGNPPKEVVIKPEESHGFAKLENNVELYNRILKFLDESIGSPKR
ncbi:MAG: prolyl oligopeptidase family serine peptidase [Burkholderiaceae bacterium]|jgi:dipeptidyl aminopeptidase/acylaminoacyl peptidase|nr:prolyl oligopeptidase family serine peptidase [Burkholderiaceae bacterium]